MWYSLPLWLEIHPIFPEKNNIPNHKAVLCLVLLYSSWVVVWKCRNTFFCFWKTWSATPKKKWILRFKPTPLLSSHALPCFSDTSEIPHSNADLIGSLLKKTSLQFLGLFLSFPGTQWVFSSATVNARLQDSSARKSAVSCAPNYHFLKLKFIELLW